MARENRLPGMSRVRDAESDSDGEDHNGQEEQEQVDEPDLPFSPGKEYDGGPDRCVEARQVTCEQDHLYEMDWLRVGHG